MGNEMNEVQAMSDAEMNERRLNALRVALGNALAYVDVDSVDDDEDKAVIRDAHAVLQAADDGTLDALLDRWDEEDLENSDIGFGD